MDRELEQFYTYIGIASFPGPHCFQLHLKHYILQATISWAGPGNEAT